MLITIVVTRPEGGSPPLMRVYTQGHGHDAPSLCGLRKAFAGTGVVPLDDCAQARMRTVEMGKENAALAIPLPTEDELSGRTTAASIVTTAPPDMAFTLIALVPPKYLADLPPIVHRVLTDGCVRSCGALIDPTGSHLAVCADESIILSWDAATKRVVYLSGGFPDCDEPGLTVAIDAPVNTFKNLCEIDNSGGGLCANPPADKALFMRQDRCGRLHVPFNWDGIFTTDPVVLAGQSATSRKTDGEENRIWIPGREFVGSTPTASSESGVGDVDWRKPDIEVWYSTDTEFGLKGVVDKAEPSTVHILPNYEVKVFCDSPSNSAVPEACEGVDRGVNPSIKDCACRDRYSANCTCRREEPGRYFACAGGDRDGMPCTRHDHCNNKDGTSGGLCNGQPVCRPAGSVYKVDLTTPTGPSCDVDADCESRTDGLTQCGYRLFDLTAQTGATPGVIQLDQRLKKGGNKRRGTCVDAPASSCNNLKAKQDPLGCSSGECRGYQLVVKPQP